jgi:Rod binding domain-containing protein
MSGVMSITPRNAVQPMSLEPQVMMFRGDAGANAEKLRETFSQFVGETFYGQMIKSMRSTVGKPAYFHGGRAEEVFQGQLDQQMAQELTESTQWSFVEPMLHRQFPHLAADTTGQAPAPVNGMFELEQLSRR